MGKAHKRRKADKRYKDCIRKAHKGRKTDKRGLRIEHHICIKILLERPTGGGRQAIEDFASYLHTDYIRTAHKSRKAHKGGLCIKRKTHNKDCIRKAHKRRKIGRAHV